MSQHQHRLTIHFGPSATFICQQLPFVQGSCSVFLTDYLTIPTNLAAAIYDIFVLLNCGHRLPSIPHSVPRPQEFHKPPYTEYVFHKILHQWRFNT